MDNLFSLDFKYNKGKPKNLIGKYELVLLNKKDPIAIDIGSAIGAFPLKYNKIFKKIFCIDASYKNIKLLNKNLEQYNINNVYSFNFAASNNTGKILKIINNKNGVYNNVVKDSNTVTKKSNTFENKEYHNTFTISFKDLLKFLNINRIDFLKLDIESSEYDFLINEDISIIDILAIEIHFIDSNQSKKLKEKILLNFNEYSMNNNGSHHEYIFINKKFKNNKLYKNFDSVDLNKLEFYYD